VSSAMKLRFRGVVSSRGEASPLLDSSGDAVLVERGRPRLLVLSCPCGCGEQFPINLDPRAGPAWRLYGGSKEIDSLGAGTWRRRRSLSVFPSVWRETGCRSHYIVWDGRIILFGRDYDYEGSLELTAEMMEEVFARLPAKGLASSTDIADALGAVPWDVMTACRRLVKACRAWEGKGKERGHFGRLRS
jgi:hypothetical protein